MRFGGLIRIRRTGRGWCSTTWTRAAWRLGGITLTPAVPPRPRRRRPPRLRLTPTVERGRRRTTGVGRPSARRCRLFFPRRYPSHAAGPLARRRLPNTQPFSDSAAQFQQPVLARLPDDELALWIELNTRLRKDPATHKYQYFVLKAGAVRHGRGRNGGASPRLALRWLPRAHVCSSFCSWPQRFVRHKARALARCAGNMRQRCSPPPAYCQLPMFTVYGLLSTVYRLLSISTVYCLLSTVYCLLSTV